MSELIISVSGLRGVVGSQLTPEVAVRYAAAFAGWLPPGPVLVTRDSRPSGSMLAGLVLATLRATGRTVVDGGITATPTTGVLVRKLGCAGGLQITASHNPAPYNGMKLFDGDGRVLDAAAGQQVLERFRGAAPSWAGWDRVGDQWETHEGNRLHVELVLKTVDVQRIRRRGFVVLLDANGGAGGPLGQLLLEQLGCQLHLLGAEPNGRFQHPPEPTAENLQGVCDHVRQVEADIGFCQDPDADRLAVIDEGGCYLGEEYTLALCLDHVLAQRPGPVVTNCASSRMSEEIARRHGVSCFRSAVGEANVVQLMRQHHAVFGGEGNGGPIDPRVGYVRDSFVGMALILDAMAARGKPVSQLAEQLRVGQMCKTKVIVAREQVDALLERLARQFADANPSRLDGLRLDWPDRWLLVRPSNTESIVRVITEAPTEAEAQQLADEAKKLLAAG